MRNTPDELVVGSPQEHSLSLATTYALSFSHQQGVSHAGGGDVIRPDNLLLREDSPTNHPPRLPSSARRFLLLPWLSNPV
jgi:hypothetical protein